MRARVRFFSVANLLSLSRVPLGAVFAWTLSAPFGGRWWPPLVVVAVAGLSDVLDGWFARRAFARTAAGAAPPASTPAGTGAWLDPVCDKAFVAIVLGAIWFHFRPPVGWLALILARELVQLPLSLVYLVVPSLRRWLHYDFRAGVPGKAATVMQFAAIVALMFRLGAAHVLALLAFVAGMIAIGDYLWRAVQIGRRRVVAGAPRLETPVV